MVDFQSDVRFAIRTMVRRPGYGLVAAGKLVLGVAATTAIFSVANGVLLGIGNPNAIFDG